MIHFHSVMLELCNQSANHMWVWSVWITGQLRSVAPLETGKQGRRDIERVGVTLQLTLSLWNGFKKLPAISPSSRGVPGGLFIPVMLFGEFQKSRRRMISDIYTKTFTKWRKRHPTGNDKPIIIFTSWTITDKRPILKFSTILITKIFNKIAY